MSESDRAIPNIMCVTFVHLKSMTVPFKGHVCALDKNWSAIRISVHASFLWCSLFLIHMKLTFITKGKKQCCMVLRSFSEHEKDEMPYRMQI